MYTHCTSIYVSKYKEETVHENVRESVQNIQLHCKSAELCVGEISWQHVLLLFKYESTSAQVVHSEK